MGAKPPEKGLFRAIRRGMCFAAQAFWREKKEWLTVG
jgi:hypothetical protein